MTGALATDPTFFHLLSGSYTRLVGASLLSPNTSVANADAARWLYEDAPFCVLAHDTEADPVFAYANRAAQRCFEYGWNEITRLHSRLSAEHPNRQERERLLDSVRERGYAKGYRGLRIAKSGRRFWIEDATVWNLVDDRGVYRGQAAVFSRWRDSKEPASHLTNAMPGNAGHP